jgi:FkbM family methyltransferase
MVKQPGSKIIALWQNRLKNFLAYYSLFGSLKEAFRFKALRRSWGKEEEKEPVQISPKALGHRRLLVRPGTTDGEVFWEVFGVKSHLPPVTLPENCVILDLGANVGFTAAHFAVIYPGAKIGLVEMDHENMALAKLNTEFARDRCCYLQAAAWSKSGTVFYGGEDKWGFRVVSGQAGREVASNSVLAMTAAEIMDYFQFDYVDYLKMDIEGAEAEILLKDNDWLDRVGSINLEYHERYNSDANFENICKALSAANFDCAKADCREDHIFAVKKLAGL